MQPIIKGSNGWSLVAEGHGGTIWTKVGYIARTVGSTLLLQVGLYVAGGLGARAGLRWLRGASACAKRGTACTPA